MGRDVLRIRRGIMREFTKSLFSYSLALSLLPLRQMQNLMTPSKRDEDRGPAAKSFDALTGATVDQFGETLKSTFHMLDNVQRGLISLAFGFFGSGGRTGRRETLPPRGDIHWSSEPVPAADLYNTENSHAASELRQNRVRMDG
jgi:hypothetical protein